MNKTWNPYKTNESKEEPKQTISNVELNYDEMNIMNTNPTKSGRKLQIYPYKLRHSRNASFHLIIYLF
jgi:hypothetical protein